MYSQGDTFEYLIDDEEVELEVVANVSIRGEEYMIVEDLNGVYHVFHYDEDLDEIEYLEDDETQDIIDYWESEYLGGEDITDFEGDEYYDREDSDSFDNLDDLNNVDDEY